MCWGPTQALSSFIYYCYFVVLTFNIALVFFLLFFFVKSSLQCATEIINLIDWWWLPITGQHSCQSPWGVPGYRYKSKQCQCDDGRWANSVPSSLPLVLLRLMTYTPMPVSADKIWKRRIALSHHNWCATIPHAIDASHQCKWLARSGFRTSWSA